MGVSGLGVAIATGGALLIYAGIRDVNPLTALRDVASGSPTPVASHSAGYSPSGTGTNGDFSWQKSGIQLPKGAAFAPLVQAVWTYKGDVYSQGKRWQAGFSDCSSFVGKGFKALGIAPPGGSVTTDYLRWNQLQKIGASQATAGDLVISVTHMAVITAPGQAIGQQSPKNNVRTGKVADIMFGTGTYGYYRYVGPTSGSASGVGRSGTVNI